MLISNDYGFLAEERYDFAKKIKDTLTQLQKVKMLKITIL